MIKGKLTVMQATPLQSGVPRLLVFSRRRYPHPVQTPRTPLPRHRHDSATLASPSVRVLSLQCGISPWLRRRDRHHRRPRHLRNPTAPSAPAATSPVPCLRTASAFLAVHSPLPSESCRSPRQSLRTPEEVRA